MNAKRQFVRNKGMPCNLPKLHTYVPPSHFLLLLHVTDAIRLTGCEFATGDMPLPVECREISDPENERHHSEDKIKNCVR